MNSSAESNGGRAKFVRLAEARVSKAMKSIRLVGNLANRGSYDFSETDVKKIFKALEHELRAAKERYHESGNGGSSPTFKL